MGHGFQFEFQGKNLRPDLIFGVPRNYSIREGVEKAIDDYFIGAQ